MKPFTSHSQSGFTLVELAIVLMIIGLLIGGVLRGQELMNNARVSSTIRQVTAYTGATITFQDAYAALPGDMPTAVNRLPGCETGNSNFCVNGNGNGIIGNPGVPHGIQTGTAVPRVETSMFWKHLAMAHLISGINPSANPASPDWGTTHPESKLRGGYNVLYMAGTGGSINPGAGHFVRLQRPVAAVFADTSPCSGSTCAPTEAASPKEAWQIDTKMDDGRPDRGDVISDDRGGVGSGCEGNAYDMRNETALCIMFFKLV